MSFVHKSRITHQNYASGRLGLFRCVNPVQNESMIYGYARVSTDGQNFEVQEHQLKAAGCEKIIREVASGAQTDRAQLGRLLRMLASGDLVVVVRLDRLAWSTRDLLNILGTVIDKGAGFCSLSDGWADTTTPHGRLLLTVVGGLAEFERELIRARTGEGRERAKARGVKMGRKPKLTPHQIVEAVKRREQGEAVREIARSYNVCHTTISRLRTAEIAHG
jgi:DNA invertase Pin-like site-specific DNA recombinase